MNSACALVTVHSKFVFLCIKESLLLVHYYTVTCHALPCIHVQIQGDKQEQQFATIKMGIHCTLLTFLLMLTDMSHL